MENPANYVPEAVKSRPQKPPQALLPGQSPQPQGQQYGQSGVAPADAEGKVYHRPAQGQQENSIPQDSAAAAQGAQEAVDQPQCQAQQEGPQKLPGGGLGRHHPNSRRAQPPRGSS